MMIFVLLAVVLTVMMLVDTHLFYTLYLSDTVVVVLLVFLYFVRPGSASAQSSTKMDG